jgi:chromosome segregation ATPase
MAEEKKIINEVHADFLVQLGLGHIPMEDFGMKIGDHKLIVAVMNNRDAAQRQEMLDIVRSELAKYNREMSKNVSLSITDQMNYVFEALKEITKKMGDMSSDISTTKKEILAIGKRMGEDESRVAKMEVRLDQKRVKIEKLEKAVALLHPDSIIKLSEELHDIVEPMLTKVIKRSNPGRVAAVILVTFALGIGTILFIHNRWVNHLRLIKQQRTEIRK